MAEKTRVGVNGYGVIGKRVADAVRAQHDMQLVGVSDVVSDYRIKTAVALGLAVYSSTSEGASDMAASGISVCGSLDELLDAVDVIVDCTAAKIIADRNLERYREHGVKAIFQGGEKHTLTGHSFVAHANYATALGARQHACGVLQYHRDGANVDGPARSRAARQGPRSPRSPRDGPVGIRPLRDHEHRCPRKPHSQSPGPNAQTVEPDLDVVTMAAKGSHTQNHLHYWIVELTRPARREEVLDALRAAPRIALVRAADGIVATNSTIELMRDLGRPRGDMFEVAVWKDILTVNGAELFFTYTVDNQAVVIPETMDAIRALCATVSDPAESMRNRSGVGCATGLLRFGSLNPWVATGGHTVVWSVHGVRRVRHRRPSAAGRRLTVEQLGRPQKDAPDILWRRGIHPLLTELTHPRSA